MMAKLMLNKGFTMLEVLIVVTIMSLFSFLFVNNKNDITYHNQIQIYNLSNKLINTQTKSLKQRNKKCMTNFDTINKYPICFNHYGNINMSQKISLINNHLYITLYLGAGTHEIKQR